MLSKSLQNRINELRAESLGGATLCTRAALECVIAFSEVEGADFAALGEVVEELRAAKPEMASIISATERCLAAAEEDMSTLKAAAERLIQQVENAGEAIAFKMVKLVNKGDRIFTHSASATVLQALLGAHSEEGIEVCVSESRPLLEGEQLARQLTAAGVPTTLVVDAASLTQLPHCQAVWVGADTITDSYFVNKVGTLSLALAADRMGIPFYVLSDSLKRLPSGFEHRAEPDHPAEEVAAGLKVRNPYFERIPLDLVTSVVTEVDSSLKTFCP